MSTEFNVKEITDGKVELSFVLKKHNRKSLLPVIFYKERNFDYVLLFNPLSEIFIKGSQSSLWRNLVYNSKEV